MRTGQRCAVAALVLTFIAPLSRTQVANTVLDFEGLGDSVTVSSQFPGATVTNAIILTAGVSLNEFEFPPRSGINVLSDNGGPITITFASPVTSVGGYFTYAAPVTMTAYAAGGAQVATATTAFTNNSALSGDPGSTVNENLSVAGAGITKITITGLPGGGSFAVDDLTVAPPLVAPTVVKPPTQSSLVITNPLALATIPLGSTVSGTLTAAGGLAPYTWTGSQLPAGVSVSEDGRITGKPAAAGAYRFIVTVTDRTGISQSIYMTFSVFGISTSSLPEAAAFASYSQSLTAEGGTPPYTFSGTGFPAGVSISAAGVISGTPTGQQGTYKLLIRAVEASGVTASAALNLVVGAPKPLAIPQTTLSTAITGQRYSQTLNAAGGVPPYSWSLAGGALPQGITLNSNGIISGTAVDSGTYRFTARVTDAAGTSATASLTLNVDGIALSIRSVAAPTGFVGIDYPVQVVTAAGGSLPYRYSRGTGSLPPGLSLAPEGTISGVPAAAGTYEFSVTVTDAAGLTASVQTQVQILPAAAGPLLSASGVQFSHAAGSAPLSAVQSVEVFSANGSAQVTYAVKADSSATWLSVTPANGMTPGAIQFSLTPQASSLAATPDPYRANVTVTCTAPSTCAGNSRTIPVTLHVSTAPAQLTLQQKSLSLYSAAGAALPVSGEITIQNTGGASLGIGSVTSGASWLKVGSGLGALSPGQKATLQVTAETAGLGGGFRNSVVTLATSAGTARIPVNLVVADAPNMKLSASGAQFQAQSGGGVAGMIRPVYVNTDSSNPISWSAAVLPGAPWLTSQVSGGTASVSAPGVITYRVDGVAVAALAPGTYFATLRVASAEAVSSPLDFQVALTVTAAGNVPQISVSESSAVFTSGESATKKVQIFSSSATATGWQASASTSDGASWLTVSPATGSSTAANPAELSIAVNAAGLKKGLYQGTVRVAGPASVSRSVAVLLVVPGGASCVPSAMAVVPVSPSEGFAAPAGRAVAVAARLYDDCGAVAANGRVRAVFSNGDDARYLPAANPAEGFYAATWVPRQPSRQTELVLTAEVPGYPQTAARVQGAVIPSDTPAVTSRGILHLFDPQPGAAVAPGTIIQIYGQILSESNGQAGAIPLPTNIADTSVTIGGIPAPLFYVSSSQINAQVPFDLTPGRQLELVVDRKGILSAAETLQVSSAMPGLITIDGGYLLAQHSDGSAVSVSAPAKSGESLVTYAAGLGATDQPVAPGAAGPSNPLARPVVQPELTINGVPAPLQFAGLTPGLVGLYQINFVVPFSPDGDLSVELTQGEAKSNAALLRVKNQLP